MATAKPERYSPALNKTETFLRNILTQNRLIALTLMGKDKQSISNILNFNKKVIDNFVLKNVEQKLNLN